MLDYPKSDPRSRGQASACVTVFVDATGVGQPLVCTLRFLIGRLGVRQVFVSAASPLS